MEGENVSCQIIIVVDDLKYDSGLASVGQESIKFFTMFMFAAAYCAKCHGSGVRVKTPRPRDR